MPRVPNRQSVLLVIVVAAAIMCGCSDHGVPSKTDSKPKPKVPDGGVLLQ